MNSAIVRLATVSDIGILVLHDRHVSKNILEQAVEARHVMVIEEDGGFAGWLRWSLFWDSIPFLNMLFLLHRLSIFLSPEFGKFESAVLRNHARAFVGKADHRLAVKLRGKRLGQRRAKH